MNVESEKRFLQRASISFKPFYYMQPARSIACFLKDVFCKFLFNVQIVLEIIHLKFSPYMAYCIDLSFFYFSITNFTLHYGLFLLLKCFNRKLG